ncbi:putative 2-aminoethylphosphonate ABC transporter ATP-binding protein [Cohnella herbarum]|uniref:Putative 2-aminoethylphosphonate ABC transporter ATP-binding protein n=1 Tax=Cohnella herbarum TaxID=2728023 RepID=A0A7Z2ZJD2_9BACL|nr:putative 2-aminoethylphosphonate ABC transporter ATP-binding protein [Cohnella herbarum]QJD81758.1 putative 2-aminoethylphosphonate ABC transporter ATP-binding protein [Cohnella herbarum]
MSQPHLSIQGVNKSFGAVSALRDINLDIYKNEFVCLLGPSGCGKTTLLRIIAGLEKSSSGSILAGGKDISKLPPAKRNFGMVFQSYALFPNLTAYENVAYGLHGKGIPKQDIEEKVHSVLGLVDLAHAGSRYPSQLSGGQQQRIALARAIVLSPDFLLLDEPLSALDAKVRLKLRHEIRELQERLGITTIMVTHDQEEALTMSDRIVVMNNAEIQQIGTPQQVYEQPDNPFVADFIGSINFLEATNDEANPIPIQAVRPEHIRITAAASGQGVSAVVKNIEFRGPFYRLLLETDSLGTGKGPERITVDVSAHVSHHLQIMKNGVVSLEVPQEKLISFTPETKIHA